MGTLAKTVGLILGIVLITGGVIILLGELETFTLLAFMVAKLIGLVAVFIGMWILKGVMNVT